MALDGNRSTVITADQFACERFRYSLKGRRLTLSSSRTRRFPGLTAYELMRMGGRSGRAATQPQSVSPKPTLGSMAWFAAQKKSS